jgi:uncharacterized damage-inducible protein DinB
MADWVALAKRFDFDAWANSLWLECLDRKGMGDPDRSILAHNLSASETWIRRCNGEAPTAMVPVPLHKSEIERMNREWRDILAPGEDRVIRFRRLNGDEHELPLSQIAEHAANHGTYHRGELRGLCRSRGDEDFPETDFLRFDLGL